MHPVNEEKIIVYSLATRYLIGEATCKEREHLVELLRNPQWQQLFSQMQSAWSGEKKADASAFNLGEAQRRMRQSILKEQMATAFHSHRQTPRQTTSAQPQDGSSQPHSISQQAFRRFGEYRRHLAIAAAFVLLAAAAATLWRQDGEPVAAAPATVAQTWVEQKNGIGERMDIVLPDGTKIILNSDSSLLYPRNFSANHRLVRLNGEAYFDVVSNANAPFIVETSTIRIRVLGTRFNVKAFNDDTQAKVTLIQGKVEIIPNASPAATQEPPVTLSAGMEYAISADKAQASLSAVNAQAAAQWIKDQIHWTNEPLPDAMRQLERRYGVAIEIRTPSLLSETVTASFDREPIQTIFELLKSTGGINYQIAEDNRIILFK